MIEGAITKHVRSKKEIPMAYKQETDTDKGDRGRRSHAFKRALLWVTALLVAVFPFPWWS
jgi:hypothetical protein